MNNTDALKNNHKDSFFRMLFREPTHFVHLYKECTGIQIKPEDIVPFDLYSDILKRQFNNDVSHLTADNKFIIM